MSYSTFITGRCDCFAGARLLLSRCSMFGRRSSDSTSLADNFADRNRSEKLRTSHKTGRSQPQLRAPNFPIPRLYGLYDSGQGLSRTECVDNDATNADQPPIFVFHSDHGSIRGNPISYESTTQAGIGPTRLAQSGFGCSACGALPVVRVRQVQVTGLRKLNSRKRGFRQLHPDGSELADKWDEQVLRSERLFP